MKYVLSILFCLNIFCIEAQIQSTFLGSQFYSSKSKVIEELNKRGYNKSYKEGEVSIYDIRLGFYFFDYATFNFFENSFCSIRFVNSNKNKETAIELYNSIKYDLNEKYGKMKYMEKENVIGFSDSVRRVAVSWKYDRSKGGEMFYYVILEYWNVNLMDKYFSAQLEEL